MHTDQIGPMLLVKVESNYAVRTLTRFQLAYLEKNPELFQNPATVLNQLQYAAGTNSIAPGMDPCSCGSGLPAEACHPGGSRAIPS